MFRSSKKRAESFLPRATAPRRLRLSQRPASVLLLVLIVVTMMSLTVGSYLALMQNEHTATRYGGRRLQARMLVESGVEYLLAILQQSDDEINRQGGLSDNSELMQSILVLDDSLKDFRGRFTVLANGMKEGTYDDLQYGMENESAKLNLNTLVEDDEKENDSARDRLLAIPGIDAAIADAILDWLDDDDSPREFGVERSHYRELSPAYQPRNGPLTALDELLMVHGVTPELLYGFDTNRSYVVDKQEQKARGALEQADNNNGELNRGIAAYLTLHSLERIETSAGESKVNINSTNLEKLYQDLSKTIGENQAKFLILYRQFGPASKDATGNPAEISGHVLDLKKEAKTNLASLYELVGARIAVKGKENEPGSLFESPWQDDPSTYRESMLSLFNHVQVGEARHIAGRINLETASRPVLKSVPGMTEIMVSQILNQRDSKKGENEGKTRHPLWILAEGIVTLDEMRQIAPYLTGGGDVYSAQVVGYFEATTPRARAEVILDRSEKTARIVAWQELTQLGPGVARSVLGDELENRK